MEIILMRHGMPRINNDRWLSAAEFGRWVSEYREAGIVAGYKPPSCSVEQAKRSTFVVCSNLCRSLESANALSVSRIDTSEELFREVDLPYGHWRHPRLYVWLWAAIFGFLWTFGYSSNAESFREARERANLCAQRLAELAKEHDTVLFVGHSAMNWMISRYLKSLGWKGSRNVTRRYWDFGVFRCSTV